tara:strand:+ start:93 stop:449 length:357 start_codon:yes stop_codon:yes gene_type:complete
MPTYEYRCNNCGHEFELFQSMSAGVKKKCPQCAKMTLERLIGTGAAVIFKGSGFYETDYRSKSYTSDKEADSKASTSSDSKTETKADTKTDTKFDMKSDKKPAKKSESKSAKPSSKKD